MAKRIKAPARTSRVQNQDELISAIARLGELEQQRASITAEAEAQCNTIMQGVGIALTTLADEAKVLAKDVQAYAEVHRRELTDNDKVKTARFATGDIGWRNDPPSVSVPRDQAAQTAIIDALHAIDPALVRTLRVMDKEAILALHSEFGTTPESSLRSVVLGETLGKIEAIPGLTIKTDVEKFFIKPRSLDAANDAASGEAGAGAEAA